MEVRGVEERCTGDEGLDAMLLDTIKYTFGRALRDWGVKSYPSLRAKRGYTATVWLKIEDHPYKHLDNARRITEFTRMLREQHEAEVDIHLVFVESHSGGRELARCEASQLQNIMQPTNRQNLPVQNLPYSSINALNSMRLPRSVQTSVSPQIQWQPIEEDDSVEDQIKSLMAAYSSTLTTATGADLNALAAARMGIDRLPGEDDTAYRTRIAGLSNRNFDFTADSYVRMLKERLGPEVKQVVPIQNDETRSVEFIVECEQFFPGTYTVSPDKCLEAIGDDKPLGVEFTFTVVYPEGSFTNKPSGREAKWKFEV